MVALSRRRDHITSTVTCINARRSRDTGPYCPEMSKSRPISLVPPKVTLVFSHQPPQSPAVYTEGHCYAFNFPHSRIKAVGCMPYRYYIDMNS